MTDFFDIIKIIFGSKEEYVKLSRGEKQKYFFLLQRRFAINFPMQSNILQHTKINQSAVIDFWHNFLYKTYNGKMPGWIYTKGVKKAKETKEKKKQVSNDTINEYCKYNNINIKVIEDSLHFFYDETLKELLQFEKILKQK